MADEPIYSDKDIFEQGGSGVVATLALAAASSGVSLPVQGAVAMVGSILGLGLGRGLYRATQRRFPLFAFGFLRAYDPDPVNAQAKAQQTAESSEDDHHYHDTILRSFRQMMDAADESVIDTLGYLAGRYTVANRRADAFFRALGRLLCDLEDGELVQLKAIVKLMCSVTPEEAVHVKIDANGHLWASGAGGGGQSEPTRYRAAPRLFSLLKREQLAGNVPSTVIKFGAAAESSDLSVAIDLSMAREILATIDPLAAAELGHLQSPD